MNAHSPGPWVAHPLFFDCIMSRDHEKTVAHVSLATEERATAIANARLITSDDDIEWLVTSVRDLLDMVRRYVDALPGTPLPDGEAEALIARIEGDAAAPTPEAP